MNSAPSQPSLPNAYFERLAANLRALHSRQPEIAAEIDRARFSQNLSPTIGRDGTPTFLVNNESGASWWGGCSMPLVAAEELTATILPQSGSVTLPSVLTGMECVVLAQKIAPRFAVFIVDDPARLKIACMLHDYVELIRAGRLVFFLSEGLVEHSRAFFAAHPGYAISPTLLKVPQFSPGELANLARTLEDAGAAAIQSQAAFIRTRTDVLGSSNARLPPKPRLAILSTADSVDAIEHAHRLEAASAFLDSLCKTCLPLSPDRCHAAARLDVAAQHRAEIVLYVSPLSCEERRFYPAELPVVCWPVGGAIPSVTGGTHDVIAVENELSRNLALDAGWPAAQIITLEPFSVGGTLIGESRLTPSSPIHLIMDLPDDQPEVAGVTMPSQLSLWSAIQQEVLRRADRFELDDASDVMRRAQQTSGTQLTDPKLLAQFESWLCDRIAPATIARSTARDLVRGGFSPQIWGRNWPLIGRGSDLRRGEFKVDLGGIALETPAWVVLPWFQPSAVRIALECLGRGCAVLMRGRPEEFTKIYPGLRELAGAIFWYENKSAAAHLRSLQSHCGKSQQSARAGADAIQARHTLTHRLQSLFDFLADLLRRSKGP